MKASGVRFDRPRGASRHLGHAPVMLALLLSSTAIGIGDALAQCVPDPPPDNAAVTCTGAGSPSVYTVSGFNLGSLTNIGVPQFTLRNFSNINGGISVIGGNSFRLENNGNVNGLLAITGNVNNQIVLNGGSLNQGLSISGSSSFSTITVSPNTFVNGSYRIDVLNGGSSTDNSGTFNTNITLIGNGSNTILNRASGTIQGIAATGGSANILNNLGRINQSVTFDAGPDTVTNSNYIGGTLNTGSGNDQLLWTAGQINGGVLMGAGADFATFRGLTSANLPRGLLIDGGLAEDRLTLDRTVANDVSRFDNWERIFVNNASRLTVDGTLIMGDSGSGYGTVSIDERSRVISATGNYAIVPFAIGARRGELAQVINAGVIQLGSNLTEAGDTLRILGGYRGNNGRLAIQTYLGSDNSPTDKLIVDRGFTTGTTRVSVTNAGGPGALTTGDGIEVVEARNGSVTSPGNFTLAAPVIAGAYEYLLVRGAVTEDGNEQSWYLRSGIDPDPDPDPGDGDGDGDGDGGGSTTDPGDLPTPDPDEDGGGTDGGSGGNASVPLIPFYRPDVSIAAVAPAVARHLALTTLGTFHERQGEQKLLSGSGVTPAGWGRFFGERYRQDWSGTVSPSFDGTIWGLQAGVDLYGIDHASGHRDRFGVFYGYSNADGDVRGFALGIRKNRAGTLDMSAHSLGAYWTHIGPSDWYVDAVLMHSWIDADAVSIRGTAAGSSGNALTASIETGVPFDLGGTFRIEPQAQLAWQHLSLGTVHDPFATVRFDDGNTLTVRLGVRLYGEATIGGAQVEPYLKANLWHTFDTEDKVYFNTTSFENEVGATALELGGGLVARISSSVALYATGSYTMDLDANRQESLSGNLGVRITW